MDQNIVLYSLIVKYISFYLKLISCESILAYSVFIFHDRKCRQKHKILQVRNLTITKLKSRVGVEDFTFLGIVYFVLHTFPLFCFMNLVY